MALEQERSKPLHNFNLPCLKWGNQRFLRCMKVNSIAGRRSSASEADKGMIGRRKESAVAMRGSANRTKSFEKSPPPAVGGSGRKSKRGRDGDDGIDAFMAKLMSDLQTATNKMTFAILEERLKGEPAPAPAEVVNPWNLRKRRATCKAPNGVGGGAKSALVDVGRLNCWPSTIESRTLRQRGAETRAASIDKQERAKFSVSLSRKEIEEDLMEMVGRRPRRRPKKRAKNVQKAVDVSEFIDIKSFESIYDYV